METLFSTLEADLLESKRFILKHLSIKQPIAIILGSGLGNFGDELAEAQVLETRQIPHYPQSTVVGHSGRWILGKINGVDVLALQGRVHYYEGYGIQKVAYPAHLLAELGVRSLIVTNAAGGLNPDFSPGDLMIIEDHINLLATNPLIGTHIPAHGPRFPDMTEAYNREYIRLAEEIARELNLPYQKGVLCAQTGPTYETPAEVRMLQRLGGDAGTMSTVPEVIVAAQRGMKVLGISCITNMATGISDQKLAHEDVTKAAAKVSVNFTALVKACILKIHQLASETHD